MRKDIKGIAILSIGVLLLLAVFSLHSMYRGNQLISVPKETATVSTPTKLVKERNLSDADKISLLKSEAHKRGLKWKVFCTKFYVDDPDGFLGVAYRGTEVDDELHDRWLEDGKTQTEAAYALYLAIQGAPTHPAEEPEKVVRERTPFICPMPELKGE